MRETTLPSNMSIKESWTSSSVTTDGMVESLTTEVTSPDESLTGPQIFLITMKVVVGIIGVIGNLMVCVVLSQIRSQKIKRLIVSQAVIDLITSVVLTTSVFTVNLLALPPPQNPFLGYLYCIFWYSGVLLFSLFALSSYNLVAISLERYLAVIHPMWYRINFSQKKAALLGLIAWLFAPVMQLIYGIPSWDFDDESCIYILLPTKFLKSVGSILFFWDFFIPSVIMGICFSRICYELIKQDQTTTEMTTRKESSVENSVAETSRSRNVTKTFLIVYIVYIICWITNQVLFLQFNLGGYVYWGGAENYFADTMATFNIACNPFIYVLHLKHYREKLKMILCFSKQIKQQKDRETSMGTISQSL